MGKASGERRSKEQAAALPVAAVKIRVISVSVTQSFGFPVLSIGYPAQSSRYRVPGVPVGLQGLSDP